MDTAYARSIAKRLERYYLSLMAEGESDWTEEVALARGLIRFVEGDSTVDLATLRRTALKLEQAKGGSALMELRLAIEALLTP
jgi:hypothetical protein